MFRVNSRFGAVIAGSVLVIFFSILTEISAAKEVVPLKIGTPCPEFRLPGVDDKMYTLKDFSESKLLVIVFTCNHCPTAQAYEERVIELHRKYHEQEVALVAVSPNDPLSVRLDELGYTDLGDDLDDMKVRAKQRDFTFPYLYDGETQEFSTKLGVLATPHVFIFDQQRILRYAGRIDDNESGEPKSRDAQRAIDELLSGKSVSVPETPVFGCSTKWADKQSSAEEAMAKWNKEIAELSAIKPADLKKRLYEKSQRYRLVNVWATWCVPCIEELDALVEMHRMYRKRHFELITISADDKGQLAKAQQVLQDKHCSAANYLLDAESRDDLFATVDDQWKGAVPYTLLISPEGEVVHRIHGELDAVELKRVIVDHIGRTYASRVDL
ncbi:MAG: redoxin domain-containing protein [Planctomycetales bacterium]|nr:redoxin domain-containing protein [Planctomycetales bacterium]